MKAKVGIVDDHPAVILGISALLNAQPDMYLAASGSSVAELLGYESRLDLVLLDLVLSDGSRASDNVSRLAALDVPVLAFTSGERPPLVREAARAGAIGMIRKSESTAASVEVIRAALRGEVGATPDWAAALDADDDFVRARLSLREAEILSLYASGETAERVGRQLFISRDTVLDHIRRIRAKYAALDRPAHNKIDLYRRAVEDGFLPEKP